MNALLRDAMLAPWRSSHASLRWFMSAIMVACILGAAAIGIFAPSPTRWMASALLYCLGACFAWAFWLSTTLLLAIDARRLQLPGMLRAAHVSLLLYGLLTVALPTLVLGALGADALRVALLAALSIAGGLGFVLLPRWCAMLFGFMPALNIGLRHVFQLPPFSDPRWLIWGPLVLVVLLIAGVLRWRQLLHRDTRNELGLGSAMVLQFRRQGAMGNWNGLQQMDSSQMIRQRPDWMQPRADLRRTGPQSTVRSLRVALGGLYMPKTLASRLRASAPVVLPILLMVPVMGLMFAGNQRAGGTHTFWIALGAALLFSLLFGGLIATAMSAVLVHQRWQRTNAELPLLALLPGLGDMQHVRHSLLRATLTIPLVTQLLLSIVALAAMLVAARFVHLGALTLLLAAMPMLAASGIVVTQVLCTLGGRLLSTWGNVMVYAPLLVLFSLTNFVPLASSGDRPLQFAILAEPWLLAAWVVMAMVLAWLARRGWRGLLARPHPFLPN